MFLFAIPPALYIKLIVHNQIERAAGGIVFRAALARVAACTCGGYLCAARGARDVYGTCGTGRTCGALARLKHCKALERATRRTALYPYISRGVAFNVP